MKISTEVKSIVCRIDFKQDLCLDEVDVGARESAGFKEAEHLQAYIYKHPSLDVEMLVFTSGEVVLAGAGSFEDVESCFWALKRVFKELGLSVVLRPDIAIEFENVFAVGNVRDYLPDVDIDLDRIALRDNAVYEPERFPGVFLSFYIKGVKSTAVLFKSGKVLIGDVRSKEDADLVFAKVVDEVRC